MHKRKRKSFFKMDGSNSKDLGKKITKTIFGEVKEKATDESSVWHYFLRSEDKNLAKCKVCLCEKIIKTVGGSTSGMKTHLRTIHKIDLRQKTEINSTLDEERK